MARREVVGVIVLALAFAAAGCGSTVVKFRADGPVLPPREGTVDVLSEQPAGCTILGTLVARSDGRVSRTELIRRMRSEAAQHGGDAIVLLEDHGEHVSGLKAGTYGGYLGHRNFREMEALAIKR